MDSNGIIWAGIAGIIGLPGLFAVIAHHRKLASTSIRDPGAELALDAPARESTPAEHAGGQAVHDERCRLLEAKKSAETAYARRVSAVEHEFNARTSRADVLLRAAEIVLEHAQEYGQARLGVIRDRAGTVEGWERGIDFDGQMFAMHPSVQASEDAVGDFFLHDRSTLTAPAINYPAPLAEVLERRRSQRILSARERLVDAMFEHRLAIAAAETQFANAKAQDDDVLSATAALEAFDAHNGKRDSNGSGPGEPMLPSPCASKVSRKERGHR